MDFVFDLGLTLPGVVDCEYYGARALKLNGRMMVCTPVNESAETGSVAIAVDFEQRAALLEEHPSVYYITDHYAPYPTLLIRLSTISRAELQRALRIAWEYAASQKAARGSKRAPAGKSR